MTFTENVVWSR